ncbi:DUF1566 domain-containing protein [Thermodesulfobacteriota bacterium]
MTAASKIQIFIIVAIFGFSLLTFAGPIPDTAQTTCYDAAGNVIDPCPQPGEDFYGEDANYTINPPSYTKLDAEGNDLPDEATEWAMVRDNVTGLTWEVKTDNGSIHDVHKIYTWCDNNPDTNGGNAGTCGNGTDTEDFINALNAENFGGFSDWRLPTMEELRSIVDYGRYSPAISTDYFPNTTVFYWSSTTDANDTISAWLMNSYVGYSYLSNKSDSHDVRAVRGGQSIPSDHLVDNEDGTVTDTHTGLMWQQATATNSMNWQSALSYCEALDLGGYTDWRLPNIKELSSLLDLNRYGLAIDTDYFPDTVASYYWSSTTDAGYTSPGRACHVNFGIGHDDTGDKSDSDYVRAVRGGQIVDIDSDGMSDNWELTNFGDLTHDGTVDGDLDGLTDLEEFQNNTDPNDNDSDDDNVTDGWEVSNSLDPNSDDSSNDTDGDKFTNGREYQDQTDPNDSSSHLIFPEVTGRIPDTGQTKYYDNSVEISRPQEGEAFYGQDAHYNIKPPSYIKMDASGNYLPDSATEWVMVRDNVTGLIWEVKTDDGSIHDKDDLYTWCDNNPDTNGGNAGTCGNGTDTEDFINALNADNFGGFSDWRLPTREKLRSIVDYGRTSPAISTDYFPNIVASEAGYYWSSTTYAGTTGHAWHVGFHYGDDVYFSKSGSYYVRAVRGGQSGSFDNFIINGDGTVTDTTTGLMWQQVTETYTMNWQNALSYCEALDLGGYTDWRLPNIKELASLADLNRYGPAIDTDYFPDTFEVTEHYWSSTTFAYTTDGAWLGYFGDGDDNNQVKSGSYYVCAVRGGQIVDIDSDGMSDNWELTNFGDLTHDGTVDGDLDGLTDLEEFQNSTNPNDNDSDDDNMPDGWEVDNNLDPNTDDSVADEDSDKFTNWREYQDQTDPNNSASHLIIADVNGRVPDTDQTKCYDNSGEITCPAAGAAFYGQDASYTINPPQYIKMDAQGNYLPDNAASWVMVKDNVTGLIWEVKTTDGSIHANGGTYTWCDNNPDTNGDDAGTCGDGTDTEDFINALNAENFGGHSDWRLPAIAELRTIIDYKQSNPAIDEDFFPNTSGSYYYSNTTEIGNPSNAWVVDFNSGYFFTWSKESQWYARAVRGEQSEPLNNFILNGNGTVTDTKSGLMWQQATAPGTYTWEQALAYCENLTFGGYTDWRLPTTKELLSLTNLGSNNPDINVDYFPDTVSSDYWSSNTHWNSAADALQVSFRSDTTVVWGSKSNSYYLRTVRGGQIVDIDSDGMSDNWELTNFGDLTHDGTADSDLDGLTDLEEFQNSTNPNDNDSDADNMTDGWEMNNSLDPNSDDSSNDPDGDKFTNGREFQDQTDPNDSSSHLIFPQITGRIPDTGQTISYTDTFGEDSDYLINPPSYIKMDAQGNYLPDSATSWSMVRDNVTGLIWEIKTDDGSIHDKDNTYTWYDSNPDTNGGYAGTPGDGTDTEDIINVLNAANFGGYSDWRLPNREDLRSIVHHDRYIPSIETTYFPHTIASGYWSSTTLADYTVDAWNISFYSAHDWNLNKMDSYYVRAVRGGQSRSLGNLVINGDGTVTDTSTGLMWQQETALGTYTWKQGLSYCEGLDLAGHTDWRLPTIKELGSIVDLGRYKPHANMNFFPDTVASFYWSSTTDALNISYAWHMYFGYLDDYDNYKSSSYYVRAVRGGQSRLLDHLIISAPQQGSMWNFGSLMSITWETQEIQDNVSISISRDSGKTYESITDSTENDGSYDWTVTGPVSVNSVLKIEPITNASKGTKQGLFSILDLNEGLVAYYPFNGNANDESGNAHHGTVHGATLVEDRFGNADGAYYFDGVNADYIGIQNTSSLSPEHISMTAWIYLEESSHDAALIIDNWSSGAGYEFFLKYNENKLRFYFFGGDAPYPLSVDFQYETNRWYFVAAVYDGSTMKLFIDAQLEDSLANTSGYGPSSSSQLTIGNSSLDPETANPNHYFKGSIDDVRLYNRGLSGMEIHKIYTMTFPGNQNPNIPSFPSPSDNSSDVSINSILSWTGGDPDSEDTITYDVYFGTSATPSLVSSDQTTTTYDPGPLAYNTTYYWKIVSRDNHGAQSVGVVWNFTIAGFPIAVLTNLPANPTNQTGISINVSGEGVVSYKYTLDSGALSTETNIDTPITESGLSEGSHTISVIGKNASEVWQPEESATTYTWTIDTYASQITLFEVRDATTNSDMITNDRNVIVAMAVDDEEIYRWLIKEDDTTPSVVEMEIGSTPEITNYSIQSPGDGDKTLYLWVMDAATNISQSRQWTILLDTTTHVGINGGDRCISTDNKIISGTRESGAAVTANCDTATIGTVEYPTADTWQVEVSELDPGNNIVTAEVEDGAGNQASDEITIRQSVFVSATIDNGTGELLADGTSTLQLTIAVKDELDQSVCDGTAIQITTDLGEITPTEYTTVNGQVVCQLTASTDLGDAIITVSDGVKILGTTTVTMVPDPISKLTFTNLEGVPIEGVISLDVNSPSSFIQIQAQDNYGHPVVVSSNTTILLFSTIGNAGEFSTLDNNWNWIQGDSSVSLAAGTDGTLFKFRASQEDQFVISAIEFPSLGWTDGILQITVGGTEVVAVIENAPTGTTSSDSAVITIGGIDITAYKYKMDSDNWSAEIDISVPITLSGLIEGPHSLYVVGKNSNGIWQSTDSPTTATWAVSFDVVVPDDLTGLFIEDVQKDRIRIGWDPNADTNVVYHVYRSQIENGIYYQINTEAVDIFDSVEGIIYFTDKNMREDVTYYYKVRAFLNQTPSQGFSNIVNATPEDPFNFDFRIINPANIVNIGSKVAYYIQLLPLDKFDGSINLFCSGLVSGLNYEFVVNGTNMGSSITGIEHHASVTIEVAAGSATPWGEDQFVLSAQNVWPGGSSEIWSETLTITVVPRNEEGIHVKVDKIEIAKGERVKIYGAILPPLEGENVFVTLTNTDDDNSQMRDITTTFGGKFEDVDWISTLEIGTYDLEASWTDHFSDTHTSALRTFIIDKGQVVLKCLQEKGATAEIGQDFTVFGPTEPAIPYAPITLLVVDPDEGVDYQTVYTNESGGYEIIDSFFTKNGLWKFKAYWEGNSNYIGCESDFLVVPVGVDFGRAIILGGGEADQTNTYWDVTKKLSVEAYRDFKARGFNDNMIYFMINSQSIDIDYNDIPDQVVDETIPTNLNFTEVISNYFAGDLNEETPLFIYMQGHGTSDGRFKVLGDDQYVSADDIKDALDQLQSVGAYEGQDGVDCPVILILESCFSGNFIQTLSGLNRIIVTSAGSERYNTDSSGRIAFSRYLFSKLREGDNLNQAFNYARSSLVNMGYPSPQLDDNGDGASDANDGLLASSTYLNGLLTWGIKPVIEEIYLLPVLEEATSTPIAVKVIKGDVAVDRVWVQIISPGADILGGETIIAYPEVDLIYNEVTEQYEGNLTDLTASGLYRVIALVEDIEHEVSDPSTTYITTFGSPIGDVNGSGTVDLADAILALKASCGVDTTGDSFSDTGDVNGDGKIGIEEVVYILQDISGLR